jgi:hypothetical protein
MMMMRSRRRRRYFAVLYILETFTSVFRNFGNFSKIIISRTQ